jgi:hypothetical protein
LGSVARKEIEGRAWVRELMWKLIHLGLLEPFGFTDEELYRQTDVQAGAAAWLAQQRLFADTATGTGEFRTLDSETLLDRPADCMAGLRALFGLEFDPVEVVSSAAFRTHSKDRSDYSAEQRAEESERGRSIHAREIEIVLEWSKRLAEQTGVSLKLPAPLLA